MAINIKKNQRILVCNACQKQHLIEKDLVEFSFECESCKNEIYIDEAGKQIIIGTLKESEAPVVESPIDDSKVDNRDNKAKDNQKGNETNQFELIQHNES